MADFYSDIATEYNSMIGAESRISDSRLTGGDLKMHYMTYTSDGTETASDTIYLGRLKEGQLYLPWAGGFIWQNGIAGTTAGEVGVNYDSADLTDDPNAFFESATITASTRTEFDGTLAITPVEIAGDGWIVFDPATLTTPAASKVLVVALPYVQLL